MAAMKPRRTWNRSIPLLFLLLSATLPAGDYLVLVDPGAGDEFLKPAREMAAIHGADLRRFQPEKLQDLLGDLRRSPPQSVVFVVPPRKIDLDLCHEILELSTRIDDDPFQDFEYGFVTGRNGAAASRFVSRIAAAWKREFGKRAAFFCSWEGKQVPVFQLMSATGAMGFTCTPHLVRMADSEENRKKTARKALSSFQGLDALLFFSHGYPNEMSGCFRARDLREWNIDLSPAVLFNSSCYNGAPGRWFGPGPGGPRDNGYVSPESSVALALLDSGICAYFAGIDAWHGPLTCQVFCYAADEGMRLGEAAKRMADRLALDFLPGRIHFEPIARSKDRYSGEGVTNRRWNGAGMIFYGDPALAPFAGKPNRADFAELQERGGGKVRIRLGCRPLLKGWPGQDFIIPLNRLTDYYSVKTRDFLKELKPEIYRVVPLPAGIGGKPRPRVLSAKAGELDVPAGKPQVEMETTPRGKLLHLRVPLAVPLMGTQWAQNIAGRGIVVELEL